MNNSDVRIKSISIENFKNIEHGYLSFENTRKKYSSSILGLYGQNGSGKTALIDAVALLEAALRGQKLPERFADYVNINADHAKLTYEFRIADTKEARIFTALYTLCIRKEQDDASHNTEVTESGGAYKTVLFDESLSAAWEDPGEKGRMTSIIDTRTDEVFAPKVKYHVLVGKSRQTEVDLLVAKKMTSAESRSFIFSRQLLNVIRKNNKDARNMFVLESLVNFGNFELFVINTANSGLISMNALPLSFKYEGSRERAIGNLVLPLNKATVIPKKEVSVVQRIINNMNIVLTQLIPGLTISVMEMDTIMQRNNTMGCRIQLLSNRNGRTLPIQYESDGIKKIISILQLLIVVYNQSSITVAVDELDSGIFEYLLGEILRIISEKGKGQLIFTSHNLRPLETLDRGFIAFTTVNPKNRYIRFSNVKTNNNLRDFYYRDIVLGEQNEIVYEPTNNYDIALAFREAGEISGS